MDDPAARPQPVSPLTTAPTTTREASDDLSVAGSMPRHKALCRPPVNVQVTVVTEISVTSVTSVVDPTASPSVDQPE